MLIIPASISEEFPTHFKKVESLPDLYFLLSSIGEVTDKDCIIVRDDLIRVFQMNEVEIDLCKYDSYGNEVLLSIEIPSPFVNILSYKEILAKINEDNNEETSKEDILEEFTTDYSDEES